MATTIKKIGEPDAPFGDLSKHANAQLQAMYAMASNGDDNATPQTEGLIKNISGEANKSREQIVQDQLAGVDQNKSFAPDKGQVEREASAAGGSPNMALAEALGRKKKKIYGEGLEQLKAKAAFDSTGRQLNAQQKAQAVLHQNAQIRHRQQVIHYKQALNKKRQENSILTSALQFGGAILGVAIGSAGGAKGAKLGGEVGSSAGGMLGSLGAGGGEEIGVD